MTPPPARRQNDCFAVSAGGGVIRAFLAFDISEEVQKKLGGLVESLRHQARGVKWTKPENFHVTLKFFGDVDEAVQRPAIEAMVANRVQSLRTAHLTCVGIGAFPDWRVPKVIWAGLKGDCPSLFDFQRGLEEDFLKMGFPKENRVFRLHLTFGRVRFKPRDAAWVHTLEAMRETHFGRSVVDSVTLYKSQLTKEGSVYTALREFKFNVSDCHGPFGASQ